MKSFLKLLPLTLAAMLSLQTPSPALQPPSTQLLDICPDLSDPAGVAADVLKAAFPSGVVPHLLCDLTGKIITDHGVGALVPSPGKGVYAEGHEKGSSLGVGQEFAVEVDLTSQDVTLRHVGDDSLLPVGIIPRASISGPLPACNDDSKRLEGFKEKKTLRWKLNTGTIPGRYNKDAVASAIKKGANNVDGLTTNCNVVGGADIPLVYDGLTGKRSNLDSSGNCKTINNYSTADFGSLPVAARTCSWYVILDGRDSLVESDVRFDTGQPFTTTPASGGCSGKLDVQATATHEFGHAFGLAHVGTDHKNLTMAARLPVCSVAPRTLGLGDIKGLKALY